MISRQWKGIAAHGQAENYVLHLRESTFPALARIAGFRGASVQRRTVDRGIEFQVVTEWDSEHAIRQFTGENVSAAVVPPEVQAMMVEYEREVAHFEVVLRT